jgi:hypothetical protein
LSPAGQERANYALFLTELCDVLDLPHPDVAQATHAHNDYVFERAVQRHLADGDAADRLTRIWQDPVSLDPTRTAAKVTREIAERLAAVSKALEAKKYPAEEVAHFLMRCLFTMFAASVKLLPEDSFRDLLEDCRKDASKFGPLLTDLWRSMNDGTFAASIRSKVLHFNGNLFAEAKVLPLGREEIGELFEAAQKNWREVEPAIFGTLLEQALDPAERRRLRFCPTQISRHDQRQRAPSPHTAPCDILHTSRSNIRSDRMLRRNRMNCAPPPVA